MGPIHVYLSFSGNCRQAMQFYQEVLGGELRLQTIGDSPVSDKMPSRMRELILQATLTQGNMVLFGTDLVPESGLVAGNTVSLILNCESEDEIRGIFSRLATDGTIEQPLTSTLWGAWSGNVTDKFSRPWMLHFSTKHVKQSNEL
ncbi:MAG TPA: VOC family protein [Catalimonadaceae bacterium]|nr:VOC family protein [Catalimonadaceae bacterium]HPI11799.1 VOC family protein [Catalimonadaceae bacterium]